MWNALLWNGGPWDGPLPGIPVGSTAFASTGVALDDTECTSTGVALGPDPRAATSQER
jgi:hypothetical protein